MTLAFSKASSKSSNRKAGGRSGGGAGRPQLPRGQRSPRVPRRPARRRQRVRRQRWMHVGRWAWRPNLGSCPAGVRGREAGRQHLSGPAFSELAALPRSPARWGAEQRRWVQRQGRSPPRPRLPGGEGAGDSGSQKRGACCLFSGVAAGVIRVFYPVYCKCSIFLPQY